MSVYKCEGCEEPLLVGERCQPCDVRRITALNEEVSELILKNSQLRSQNRLCKQQVSSLQRTVEDLTAELNRQSMAIERAKTRPPSAYPFTMEW
ncbi:MAG: hypothetical protein GY799_33275 [Desulfobulbaceae bacterium]|nr:hypothetical protein [Desulfobulbaceae bacterium]